MTTPLRTYVDTSVGVEVGYFLPDGSRRPVLKEADFATGQRRLDEAAARATDLVVAVFALSLELAKDPAVINYFDQHPMPAVAASAFELLGDILLAVRGGPFGSEEITS